MPRIITAEDPAVREQELALAEAERRGELLLARREAEIEASRRLERGLAKSRSFAELSCATNHGINDMTKTMRHNIGRE